MTIKIIIGVVFVVVVTTIFSIIIYRLVKKRNELKKHLFINQKLFKFVVYNQPKIESELKMLNLYLKNFDKVFSEVYIPYIAKWFSANKFTDKKMANIEKDISIRIVDYQEVMQDGKPNPVWGVYFYSSSTICIAPIDKKTDAFIEEAAFHNLVFHEISHVIMKYYTGDSDVTHKSELFKLERGREKDIEKLLTTLK